MTNTQLLTEEDILEFYGEPNQDSESDKYYLRFEDVVDKKSERYSAHLFVCLDTLMENKKRDIIGGSKSEVIYLNIKMSDLGGKITKEELIDLCRAGLLYCDDYDFYIHG